jgi:aspartyl-tRNA(Asn)/glutamyl-tRNA(Gln) amidotransferase subunit A
MIFEKTISEIVAGLKSGQWSVADLVNEAYSQIETHNSKLNALITVVDKKTALKRAAELQVEIDTDKPRGPLHGIPFVMKDSYQTEGIKTTAGAKILENYVSPYSSTVYQRLINAGAILVGKANMDAWGHGASNENSDFGPVKNPFDQTRVAGGSGGGPAAAVSAGMAVFGIGEDTGGSIRNPAVWCNLSAMKVTYGRVSRWGCIAYASSFDTVGPTAKSAADCAVVLSVIAGVDKFDATSSPEPVDLYVENMTNSVRLAPKNEYA